METCARGHHVVLLVTVWRRPAEAGFVERATGAQNRSTGDQNRSTGDQNRSTGATNRATGATNLASGAQNRSTGATKRWALAGQLVEVNMDGTVAAGRCAAHRAAASIRRP